MSVVRTVSRFVLFFFVAVFATTAMSGESATPSGTVSIQSRSIAVGVGVSWGDGKRHERYGAAQSGRRGYTHILDIAKR